MRILIAGNDGQLAACIRQSAQRLNIDAICVGRPDLDLTIPQTITDTFDRVKPDVVVNVAAYTDVDLAEDQLEQAMLVNGQGAGLVASACQEFDIPLIHISTDYVFDGENITPYIERDVVSPINAYGRSKLMGEDKVTLNTKKHVILRTSWVYSPCGKNFLKTMLNLAHSGKRELKIVNDQFGNPTSAIDLAGAIIKIAENLVQNPDDKQLFGIFHLSGSGITNWADFALKIFEYSREIDGPYSEVFGIPSSEYPTKAQRPKNSRLDCSKIAAIHGIALPVWEKSTKIAVTKYLELQDWRTKKPRNAQ
ncbi:MAG: dTDP-4-dehydrorhamnose reductase [Hyphomonadaceae bacterium]|nr:MAG: dTDP-4-dehydrorhamnose reductase [Hyphomonadaceae bacterium]KAF0183273.1 MAG: dTDP-4-dehydrorhamnose reductase [Hyphomonadaceae bacterium]